MIPKLFQWLIFASIYLAVWIMLLIEDSPIKLSPSLKEIVFASPVYLLMTFACYSLAVIGYRVMTFNDCTEAAEELKQQIQEAKADLEKKGLKMS